MLVQAGDMVPADLELVEARGLEVDEWELTGEMMPVEKRVDEEPVYLYEGSRVTRGSGKGVVVAAGEDTEYGQILEQTWEKEKRRRPPLVKRQYLILLVLLLPPFIVALLRYGNSAWSWLGLLTAAVVMILMQNHELYTYVLASRQARRLETQGIQIRDASSLDMVGQLDVICLDKTGVLTTLDIEVRGVYFGGETPEIVSSLPNDERGALAGIGCALCNDLFFLERRDHASPIDRALMSFGGRHGWNIDEVARKYRRIYDKPFESEDRYMAAGFDGGPQTLCFAKGDPEVVLRMCRGYMASSGAESRMAADFWRSIIAVQESARRRGETVLALACSQGSEMPPPHYTFLCLISLHNPLRPPVRDWIRSLGEDGVRTLMLTGDREETARTIGMQAGIHNGAGYVLSGKDIARMPLDEVARQARQVSIYARLLPHQKGILVRLLQQRGHLVAMVGDGANDTIALKSADVSLSFLENSSPFARKVSKILVHDLGDVPPIIAGAKRIDQQLQTLGAVRALALIGMLIGLYWWMVSQL